MCTTEDANWCMRKSGTQMASPGLFCFSTEPTYDSQDASHTHTLGVLEFLKILTVLDPFTCMIIGNKWCWSLSSGQTLALPGLSGTVLTLSRPVSICKYRNPSHWPHLYQRGNVKDKQSSTRFNKIRVSTPLCGTLGSWVIAYHTGSHMLQSSQHWEVSVFRTPAYGLLLRT